MLLQHPFATANTILFEKNARHAKYTRRRRIIDDANNSYAINNRPVIPVAFDSAFAAVIATPFYLNLQDPIRRQRVLRNEHPSRPEISVAFKSAFATPYCLTCFRPVIPIAFDSAFAAFIATLFHSNRTTARSFTTTKTSTR